MRFETLLDVGGAEGYHASLARRVFGARVVSSDLSLEANLRAREFFGLPVVASDAHWLPYRDESFDVVLCCEVLEHVADPVAVMCEAARVARRYAVFATEHACTLAREREIRLLLADRESPHSDLNFFLPQDFATVLGQGMTHERQARVTRRYAELEQAGREPRADRVRRIIREMTRPSRATPADYGIVAIKAKGDAPPIDISQGGDPALLDTILAHKVAPAHAPHDIPEQLDPLLREMLACPACLLPLEQAEDSLRCTPCGRSYRVDRGVPCLHLERKDTEQEPAQGSRCPALTDEAQELRGLFTAPRPASRLLCHLLDLELSLLNLCGPATDAGIARESTAELRSALTRATGGGEASSTGPVGEPKWWDRLPATDEELKVMRELDLWILDLLRQAGVPRGGSVARAARKAGGRLLRLLRLR
ncbi:MAG: methyltransferase domain-containing protein [Armatimonadota bacterium]|nr:MAG: methyltransferase domain-containing protein [Armatimonadota bacterium]